MVSEIIGAGADTSLQADILQVTLVMQAHDL